MTCGECHHRETLVNHRRRRERRVARVGSRDGAGRQLTERGFKRSARELIGNDPALAAIVERHGLPDFWARQPGFATLLLLILEQQVSLASARAAYDRVDARVGGVTPAALLELSDAELREDGFSRQKTRYARALAAAILARRAGAGAARGCSTTTASERRSSPCRASGPGRRRCISCRRCAGRTRGRWETSRCRRRPGGRSGSRLARRRSELEAIGERWRPHRATAARLLWHLYLSEQSAIVSVDTREGTGWRSRS